MNTETITPNGYNNNPGYSTYADGWRYVNPMTPSATMPAPTQIPTVAPVEPDNANRNALNQVHYWVGAGLTAVITALVGLVGLVIAQGILNVPVVLGSGSTSTLTTVSATAYGLAAAGIALLAAGLYAGMLRIAPRPTVYYSWIAAMVTLLAVLLPFTSAAGLHSQIALALTNLGVGLVIGVLVPLAATNAARR